MVSPHSSPHSTRPSRSPSPTSGPNLSLQTLLNTSATTTTPTPRKGIATDSVAGGDPAVVHHPGAPSEFRQSSSQSRLSKAFPFLSPGLDPRPTSTLPSERLTRARPRSVSSLEKQSQRTFGGTSYLETTSSDPGVHRASRGGSRYVSLFGVAIANLNVVYRKSKQGGLAARDARSNDVGDSEQPETFKLPTPKNPAPRTNDSTFVRQRLKIPFWIFWYWILGSEQEVPGNGVPWQMMVRSPMTLFSVSSTNLKVL